MKRDKMGGRGWEMRKRSWRSVRMGIHKGEGREGYV